MKKVFYFLILSVLVFSCKNDKKEPDSTPIEKEQQDIVDIKKEKVMQLPGDLVQLNKEITVGNGINLIKAQIKNHKDDKFIYKVFMKSTDFELYRNGKYSLFIQHFPYEDNLHMLDEKFQKSKSISFWVNLESAKPYTNGEYVVFKSFSTQIYNFEKIVVGVMDLENKQDVFRTQFDDPVIIND